MKNYILSIGLLDQTTKKQEISTEEAYKMILDLFCKKIGGATIYEAHGVYTHEDGTIIDEPTIRAESFTDDEAAVFEIIQEAKKLLNQESIGLLITEPKIMFI